MAMKGAEERGTGGPIDPGTPRKAPGRYVPQRTVDWGRAVTEFITEHAELCLGIALALGAVIGLVVKRR